MNLRRAYSLQLNEKWIKTLQELPESGMGYQNVSVDLGKSDVEGIVFNCSILKTDRKITNEEIGGFKVS